MKIVYYILFIINVNGGAPTQVADNLNAEQCEFAIQNTLVNSGSSSRAELQFACVPIARK